MVGQGLFKVFMMNGEIIISLVVIAVSLFMFFALIRFITKFYKNPQASVQRIRLHKNSYLVFSFVFLLNIVFTLGFVSDLGLGTQDIDLIAILVYVIGLSSAMLLFSFYISKVYKSK